MWHVSITLDRSNLFLSREGEKVEKDKVEDDRTGHDGPWWQLGATLITSTSIKKEKKEKKRKQVECLLEQHDRNSK